MAEAMIYKAMLGVMHDIGAIGKDKVNQGYGNNKGYKFRGIDQVYNALQPALIKNGVFPSPCVHKEEREERKNSKGTLLFYSRLTVTYRFYAEDGSYVEATVIGEAMDSGDKATNKAMSAAYKYACFQVFCIPTEEMIDSDRDSYEFGEMYPAGPEMHPVGVTENHINAMRNLMKKKGYTEEHITKWLHINKLEDMSMEQHNYLVKTLSERPDKSDEENKR